MLVRSRNGGRSATTECRSGANLRSVLDASDLRVRSGCNGNGSCGLCRVRILSGQVSSITEEERLTLGPLLLESGVRLACRTLPLGDVELEVVNPAPHSSWRTIPDEALLSRGGEADARPGIEVPRAEAIALDIGTTNLCMTLWTSEGSRRLAARRGPNPQGRFGADVVTRLEAARDPSVGEELVMAVKHAVASALGELEVTEGIVMSPSTRALAVGNTAMLCLLRGCDGGLLTPEAWASPLRFGTDQPLRWKRGASGEVAVELVPPLGGFVGSDLLAAVLAAELTEKSAPALLVDFGTNTEIALWDGETLWVTSGAGGPAFEASGVRCAVPAEIGAIYRVRTGEPFAFEVIGGGEPLGVCGSGLVDWMACLVRSGLLSERGAFSGRESAPSLGGRDSGIVLAKRDIDVFQRAKAAIGAGVRILALRAGIRSEQLRRVVTTGLFGRALDVGNAQAIGLLPNVPRERVETYDNLALAGCEAMLLSSRRRSDAETLRTRTRLINLARCSEFEERFFEGLFLAPMEDR